MGASALGESLMANSSLVTLDLCGEHNGVNMSVIHLSLFFLVNNR